jgi:hypothetical protein
LLIGPGGTTRPNRFAQTDEKHRFGRTALSC